MSVIPADSHEQFVADATNCTACRLCLHRTHLVVSQGLPTSRLMLIGEAPNEAEDRTGIPLAGSQGKFLERLFARADLSLYEVYVCNVVKCRPPNNRNPTLEEIRSCRPFLEKQIALVNPACIITTGKIATTSVTGTHGLMQVLMQDRDLKAFGTDIPVVPLYHPAYYLRRINDSSSADLFREAIMNIRRAFEMSLS